MSGPATATFSLAPLGAVFLAAQAIREARAMHQEYDAALEQLQEREAELAKARRQEQEVRLARLASLERETGRLESRLERLRGLAELSLQSAELAAAPLTRPAGRDEAALLAHARAVKAEIARIEALLAAAGANSAAALQASLQGGDVPALDDILHAYVWQRRLHAGLDASQAEAFRHTAARILERLELAAGASLPHELEALAREIVLAPSVERAEALAAELRLGVQRQREESAARQAEADEAKAMLEALHGQLPAALRAELESVAAGNERLAPPTRAAAAALLAALETTRQRQEQEAAALVLEQSLRDLGYEVEAVRDTLFVEGGMVHFQRPGWEGYFVRLRLDPREKTINFNVVRARGAEENAERRRLDTLAEDRWCAEFPKLLQTLAARGINLNVTRLLGAGELPVQAVDPASLPQPAAEEPARRAGNAPRQRELE